MRLVRIVLPWDKSRIKKKQDCFVFWIARYDLTFSILSMPSHDLWLVHITVLFFINFTRFSWKYEKFTHILIWKNQKQTTAVTSWLSFDLSPQRKNIVKLHLIKNIKKKWKKMKSTSNAEKSLNTIKRSEKGSWVREKKALMSCFFYLT
jgi:hypothetical protein